LGILAAVLIATNAIITYFWQKAKEIMKDISEKVYNYVKEYEE